MDRREVVNNPDEYDTPGEWGSSGATGLTPGGVVPANGRFRYGGMRGASGRPGADPWSLPRPDTATVPQVQSPQSPTAAKSTRFRAARATSSLMCLYLGPGGERCDQPALDNGFCPRHQPNASSVGTVLRDQSRGRKKKAAATIGIIAAMWPIVEQILRAIFHLFR